MRINTLLALWLLVAARPLWPQTEDPAALLQRAFQAQQTGNYAASAEAYRAFLKLRPDEVGAHSNLGVVLAKLGRYDEAIAEYEVAGKLAPHDPRIALNLALAYSKSGRLREAAAQLEALHSTAPQDVQVTLLLADTDLRMGEDQHVIALLTSLEDSPNLAVAYMLGTALIRTKQIDEGQVLLDRILKNGDSVEARFLLGTRMFESGDYPAAVKQFASAIELNPRLSELQSFYGQALLITGDADGASEAFRRELANNRNDYRANLGLGQILVARRHFDDALPLLQQAVLVRPQSAEAVHSLGEALLGLGRTREGQDQFAMAKSLGWREQAAESDPGPKVNEPAPDFSLPEVGSGKAVSLRGFKRKTPVVLVFGSYSCPNFRGSAAALEALYAKYGRNIPFLLVYIREAHTQQNWESARNVRAGIAVAPAANLAEKQEHAVMCSRKLHLRFPALVDGMDGAVETAYAAWPSRAVIVGVDGQILYTTRLTELDFHANEMEACLKRASAK
jgi:Flp pilus assembly protein TadD/peroxiredoxin